MRTPNAQSTTLQLNTSLTTAKSKKPTQVGKYVMAVTHRWLMAVAKN